MSIFDSYQAKVRKLCGGKLLKRLAIDLSEDQARQREIVAKLRIDDFFATMSSPRWAKHHGRNWEWRTKVPAYTHRVSDGKVKRKIPEVALERETAMRSLERWTCQMSTCSGLDIESDTRRHAIDLVRHCGERHFAFIELKVESDNPLYATFELLGYTLAYLQAKANGWQGTGKHNVFEADKIDLCVVAPEVWYGYRRRGSDISKFDFTWLSNAITDALNRRHGDSPKFSFAYRSIPSFPDTKSVDNLSWP